jgi:quercetin dioxygenase-like cupin family protein
MTSQARSCQEGQSAWLGGLRVEIKIAGNQTGRAFSLVEATLEPGRLIPPHVHTREDEYSYVLEGEIGARIGDQIMQATAGCTVMRPRGIPHTLWNVGPLPARMLDPITPAGLETYFMELGELFRTGALELEQVAAVAARYGITPVMDWVPELTSKYQLKLVGE